MFIKNYALLVLDRIRVAIKITMDNVAINLFNNTKITASYLKLEIH